jgi:Tfp pilus assembly protein PilX
MKKRFLYPQVNLRLSTAKLQRGVLLIVTMIMLLIISGVAALAIKGTSSTEAVANNTRTQALAMQAAEAALRYTEIGVINTNYTNNAIPIPAGKPTYLIAIAAAPTGVTGDWSAEAKWDGATSTSTVVTRATLDGVATCPANSTYTNAANRTGSFCSVYKRSPECMTQYADSTNKIVLVTCRGFGPEVVDSSTKELPSGAEVFLQSVIRLPY